MLASPARRLLWTLALAPGASACDNDSPPRDASASPWVDAETNDAATELDASTRDGAVPDAGPRHDAGPSDGFTPWNGLGEGGVARAIGTEFSVFAQSLVSHHDGSSWLFWRSYPDPDFSSQTIRLEQFDADGRFVRASALSELDLDGVALRPDGSLIAWRNDCGPLQTERCFYREPAQGPVEEHRFSPAARSVIEYTLDWDGNLADDTLTMRQAYRVSSVVADAAGLYALMRDNSYVLQRFDGAYRSTVATELTPAVFPPEVPLDAPFEDLLRAGALARVTATELVLTDRGVVVAFAAARGVIAALNQAYGLALPLPEGPTCSDVVVVLVSADGTQRTYWSVPTPGCEALPKLAVVGQRAVVASWISVAKPPEPNDTAQYDIGISIVDLATGETSSRTLAWHEDDIAHSIAPCGENRVCLGGTTGARSVDTGSTVTYGKGFVLPLSLIGEPGVLWTLTSARHTVVHHVAPGPDDSVYFFATVNGPITHTADNDPSLGYNEGLLGKVRGL